MGIDAIRTLGIPGLLHIAPIGGSSTLYRARQLSKDRAVALRFLDWDSDAAGRQRSASLVRALQTLSQHPHVVTVYGSGQVANGPTYLLLELLEDGSLGEWVAEDGRLPCTEVLEVAVKIGGALETAHRAGVAHGHLRADNVLVSPSGEPQLAGLDRAVLRHVQALMNGTLPASVDDDLTGLASTMFTLLTATEPLDGQVKDVLERSEVPAPVRGLIERCLARDHAFCPTSIRDLTAAIQQVQQVLGLAMTDSVVDERAAEDACQALHEATVPPSAEPEPTEPESEEAGPELEPEAAALELWSAFTPSEPEPRSVLTQPEPEPEPLTALTSPEPVPAEPEPRPALVAPVRPAYQRRRRLVITATLALLAAVAALVTAQLLRSRHPSSAADQEPPAVVMEQPASNRDAIYTGFRTLIDESGQLSMIVPVEWSAVRSSVWIINGKKVGNRLEATLEGPVAEPWSRPFAVLAASQTLGSARTVDQVLDQLRILPGECTYVGRRPFNDNLYAGAIDAYTGCGQLHARIETLVATSKKPSHLVMVQVARVAARDEKARDRVMETFQVSG